MDDFTNSLESEFGARDVVRLIHSWARTVDIGRDVFAEITIQALASIGWFKKKPFLLETDQLGILDIERCPLTIR